MNKKDNPQIVQAWQEAVQHALKTRPWFTAHSLQKDGRLFNRFADHYRHLSAAPRKVRRRLGAGLATAALILALGGIPAPAQANAVIQITPGAAGITTGDGCSLVEAIINANNNAATHPECAAGSGADTIVLAGNTYSYGSAFGDDNTALPLITSPITIEGNGATIQGTSSPMRVLRIEGSGDLTLNASTITGGNNDNRGGGILNLGTLTLNESTVHANQTTLFGGGIYNLGGTVTANNSTISGNTGRTGGIDVGSGTVTLNNSTVSGNTATNNAGGISTYYGTLNLNNSTVSGNTATNNAGGIYSYYGTLNLNNSTVSDNNASNFGGGIFSNTSTLTLARTLVSGNTASSGAEIRAYSGIVTADAHNVLGHSGFTNAQAFVGFTPGDSDRTATSDGTNPTPLSNILNTTLADNGGPTRTHALVSGSPAIDYIPTTDANCNPGVARDQRGAFRANGTGFGGSACDVGAFEFASAASFPVTASTGSGNGVISPALQQVTVGLTAEFTVVPNPGWSVGSVTGDTCNPVQGSGDQWVASNITEACAVTANFVQDSFEVIASVVSGQGTITPVSQDVLFDGTANFTVTPQTGWSIDTVAGNPCSPGLVSGEQWEATNIQEACSVEASFVINVYTVTAETGEGEGTITPASQDVEHGGDALFTITPDATWSISSVTGDTCSPVLDSGDEWVAAEITEDCAVIADFVRDVHTIGGEVSGLEGVGLELTLNDDQVLAIAGDGEFTFPEPLADGSDYQVTVLTDPTDPAQTCTVANGSGTLSGADVTDVAVNCASVCPSAGGIIHVDAAAGAGGDGLSWSDAFVHLQDALAQARSCALDAVDIWVAGGTYYPDRGAGQTPGDRDATFRLPNNVAVYGGFEGTEGSGFDLDERDFDAFETILSGDINNSGDLDGNSYSVVTAVGTTTGVLLDGFTVTSGNSVAPRPGGGGLNADNATLDLANLVFSDNSAGLNGGALWIRNGSAANLHSITFQGNSANGLGGAIFVGSSSLDLINVGFIENEAGNEGGAVHGDSGNVLSFESVLFHANTSGSFGGAMASYFSPTTLVDVTFSDNSSGEGGALAKLGAPATLVNVTFTGNSADVGGGMRSIGDTTLLNVTFTDNTAEDGGALWHFGSDPLTLVNTTISGNAAVDQGGGLHSFDSTPVLINTLIAGNTAPNGPDIFGTVDAASRHNLIGDGSGLSGISDGVNGNLVGSSVSPIDPLLADLADYGGPTETLALLPGSPAIEAGDNDACADPDTVNNLDQRGITRPQGSACDIGAFESRGFSLARISGDNQSTLVETAFADDLVVGIGSDFDEPVDGGRVAYLAPDSGASLSEAISFVAIVEGQAALNATANAMAGSYTVAAETDGSTDSIGFNLTNLPQEFAVTASVATGLGSISPSSQNVIDGDTATFTVIPGTGWSVDSVTGNTCSPEPVSGDQWQATDITADCAVEASFVINTYTVTAATGVGEGSITPALQDVEHGGDALFTVAPDTGWSVTSVSGDTCSPALDSGNQWIAAGITEDCAVTANFAQDTFEVSASVASGGGSISPSTQNVPFDGTATFTVTPDTGWSIDSVVGNACSPELVSGDQWQAPGIRDDCAVTAAFVFQCPADGILRVDRSATGAGTGLSWADAFTDVQIPLTALSEACEIWVAGGVYTPITPADADNVSDAERRASFVLRDGIALYGGFAGDETERDQRDWVANPTVLSGDIDDNDTTDADGVVTRPGDIVGSNSHNIVTGSGTDHTAVLDGFLITAGLAQGGFSTNRGAGVLNDAGSPRLANLVVIGNFAEGNGGGMHNRLGSNPQLINVAFRSNRTSGVNGGGGMFNSQSSPELINVVFSGNRGNSGGGMMNQINSSPSLTNVTFTGNAAIFGDSGGALYNEFDSNPSLRNTLIWNNRTGNVTGSMQASIVNRPDSTPSIAHSLVQGCNPDGVWNAACGTDGGGNPPDADPRFIAPLDPSQAPASDGNPRLQAASPAIDVGNNEFVADVPTDFDGNPRIFAGSVDLGAFETAYFTVTPSAGEGGDLDPATAQRVLPGDSVVFTLAPEPGWSISGVGGSCGGTLDGTTYTTEPISEDCTVTADFAQDTFEVSASVASGEGGISPSTQNVVFDGTATFTVTPDTGWSVDSVVGNACSPELVSGDQWQATGIQQACAVQASFAINVYTVTAAVGGGNGSIDPPSQPVEHGSDATFTVTPDTGWSVTSVTGNTCAPMLDSGDQWIAAEITEDCAVTANFAQDTFEVSASVAAGQGTIAPTTQNVVFDGTATFTVTPDTGWSVDSVVGNACSPELVSGDQWQATGIQDDCAVEAAFAFRCPADGILRVDRSATGTGTGLSWADAFTDVQIPLTALSEACEIWVAGGVYTPIVPADADNVTDAERRASFVLRDGIALYGGFAGDETERDQRDWTANPTVLSGDINQSGAPLGNSYRVVRLDGGTDAALDGFTVTAGNADGDFPDNSGGGLLNEGGRVALANVRFSNNSAAARGGAMAGIGGEASLVNVVFSGNAAGEGGAMANDASAPALTNVTFTGNRADDAGGALFNVNGSAPLLRNALIWNNGSATASIANDGDSTPSIAHSLIQGCNPDGVWNAACGADGGGNPPDADPRFIAPLDPSQAPASDGNPRLQAASPAVDVGNNDFVDGVPTDFDGNPRIFAGSVDLGAFETAYFTVTPSAGEGGDLDPATAQRVLPGDSVVFTLAPEPGWSISGVGGSCGGTLDGTTYTTEPISEDCTVTADFAQDTFEVSASVASGEGGISPSTQNVVFDGTATFTVTPDTGWSVGSVVGDTCTPELVSGDQWQAAGIQQTCAVHASFAINVYTVTAAVGGGNGSIDPPSQPVEHGANATFTITPQTGWSVTAVSGDTCSPMLDSDDQWIAAGITEDCAVTANFAQDTFEVSASVASGEGGISPSTQNVVFDGTATFTVTPGTGWSIDSVVGNACSPELVSGDQWQATGIREDCAVEAAFAFRCPADGILRVDRSATGTGTGLSWADAFTDVQIPLTALSEACEIWVAGGVYTPIVPADADNVSDAERRVSFVLRDGIALYGGFAGDETERDQRDWTANPTVLSGDINQSGDLFGNSYRVVRLDGGTDAAPITPATVIDGFTVTAGNADGSFPDNAGGAVHCAGSGNACNPVLTHLVISGNHAVYGAGLYNDASNGGTASPILTNVVFSGNRALYGAGLYNDASNGGTSHPILNQVTVTGNAAEQGGGMFSSGGDARPELRNSLLWNNAGGSIDNETAVPIIAYSLVQGCNPGGVWNAACGADGGGNPPDADPRFIAPLDPSAAPASAGNPRLQAASPAVDVGNNEFVADVPTDLDGNPRIFAGTVDLGAFETRYATLTVDIVGDGRVDIDPAATRFDPGATVELLAVPENNWQFQDWRGALTDTANPLRFDIDADTALTAAFVLNTYTVTPSAGTGGSIAPDTPQTVDAGQTATFTVTPDTGWSIDSVAGCDGTLTGNQFTTGPITADCTVEAGFAINTYTIGGSVSGLEGEGLVLQNNGGDDLAITTDGDFVFATPLAHGSDYTVTVFTQPTDPNQTCTVANAAGEAISGDVDDIVVACEVIDAACGQADGVASLLFPPEAELCAIGTLGESSSAAGEHTWTCRGIDTGEDAACRAPGADTDPFGSRQATVTFAAEGCTPSRVETRLISPFALPEGVTLPFGTVDFTLEDCERDSATVTLSYSEALDGLVYWKYIDEAWTVVPAPAAVLTGNTVTFTLADNGPYDADPTPGVIRDPSGPGTPALLPAPEPQPIPTLRVWGLLLLIGLIGWIAWHRQPASGYRR